MGAEPSSGRPAAWMIAAAFWFATMGALTHAVAPRCDWILIALVRVSCSFVMSASLAAMAGAGLVVWRPRTLWLRSAAGTIGLICTFYALSRLPVADVLTLTNAYPLWIVLMSVHGSPPREVAADLACVLAGVAGVALIQRPHAESAANLAAPVALAASFATAVAMLGLHRLRHVDSRAVVAHFSGLATLVLLAWTALHPALLRRSDMDAVTALVLLGVGLSGTIGQIFLTKAYGAGLPSRVAVLSLTQVLFGMIFDVLIDGRLLGPVSVAGFLLVLGPTAWVTARRGRIRAEPADRP
ncbi:EamA-like transporter family protein [Aquisphaera giovannonii]|uniref:EamA-like transporter family protein n=1 Tax=Aquisphaera giovannonii TaxID=406548 RepID=A0A5B9W9D9_9BACT|nr:DMT family transporter [Aquisphaera giovannonii]QEH36849.1 EamA-like transporter family protein [Aquisphaera giovannonii]